MKFIGTKTLETERLILRRLTMEDAPRAFENWCNDPDVVRYLPWECHGCVENTIELYKVWTKEYDDLNTYRWIVEEKESGDVIGTIDVVNKDGMKYDVCEIGYCYAKKAWGKGYGTEAMKRVMEFLFKECDAYLIHAKHMSKNPGSGRVMAKSGLICEGSLRDRMLDKDGIRNDVVSYSITRDEYLNKNA